MLGLILIGGLLAISAGLIFLFRNVLDNNGKKILAGEIKQPEAGILRKFYDVDANYYAGLFFSIGLVVSVAMMLLAFTWKFHETEDLAEYVAPVADRKSVV